MHEEFSFIRKISKENSYPSNFVENQINKTLTRYVQTTNNKATQGQGQNQNEDQAQKQETKQEQNKDINTNRILIDVPFTGNSSKKFIQDIKRIAKQLKPTAEVLANSRPPKAVGQFSHNKDKIKEDMQSNIVYQLNCSSCQATYIGKTIRQMRRRLKEHGAQQPLISNPNC